MLDEIIVTAQRRAEASHEVPITLTTVSEDQLRSANIRSMMDLPRLTPGLRLDQQGAYTQPTIRGIGTSVVQTGSGSSVGIYVDGFYLPSSVSADLKFLNVESVQVLKGPQGTLFGRNTPGGAILVKTAEPSQEPRAIGEVSYGRFNTQNYQGYFSRGLTDNVAVSIEGNFTKSDGFQKSVYDGSLAAGGGFAPGAARKDPGAYENWALRASLKADLGAAGNWLVRYSRSDADDPTALVTSVYRDDVSGRPFSAGDAVPGTVFGLGRGKVANNGASTFTAKADTYQVTGDFDLGFATLTSYTQYREEQIDQYVDSDGSSADVFALGLPEDNRILSQEFLLNSSHEGPLQYTAGLFLFKHTVDAVVMFPMASGFEFPFSATGVDIRTYAAFMDATYEVNDKLYLTAGLRFSRDQVKDPYYQTTPGVPGIQTYQPEFSDNKVTPRFVVRYKPTEESNVYLSYTKGYKSAIFDPRATSGSDYLKPEDVEAWEVGYKYADSRLNFSFAPFYYQYENLQNAYYRVGETILSNAAESTIKGVETELRMQVMPSLEILAAATWLDATYDEYVAAGYFEPNFNGDGRFAGFTPVSVDAGGNQMQRSPKLSGNLSARYTTTMTSGSELGVSGNLYYTSKFYYDPAKQFEQDAYSVISARVDWTPPGKPYTLSLYGDNLADEKYTTQVNPTAFGAGVIWGTPRVFGVALRIDM